MREQKESKRKQAVEMILEIMSDGKSHSFNELQNLAIKTKIVENANDRAVTNAISFLKNNYIGFKSISRGEYIIIKIADDKSDVLDFDKLISQIYLQMDEIKEVNLGICPDAELKETRIKIAKLIKLAEDVNKQFQG